MAKAPSLEDILARVPEPLRCKLDQRLDEGHEGVSRHLGYIAQNIPEWEGRVADQLGLTEVNIRDIKFGPARDQQEMQRSVRYVHTHLCVHAIKLSGHVYTHLAEPGCHVH